MPAQGPSRAYRITALAFMAIAIVGHAVYLLQRSSPDAEMFVYMGKLVAIGSRPGIDLIDNKFPTVGLLMSVPYRLLGANWLGYGLLSLTATIGSAFILARGAERHFGAVSYWPTLTAAMIWGNFFLCIFSLFQLEHLQLLFGSIAGVAALSALRDKDWRDALLVGLAAGVAAWLKPNALSVFGAFGVMLLLQSQSTLLIAAVAGLLIPTAVAAICLNASGTLALLPEITQQISKYSGHSAWHASELLSKLVDLSLLFALPFLVIRFSKPRLWNKLRASLSPSYSQGRGTEGEGISPSDCVRPTHTVLEDPLPCPLPCEYKWEREVETSTDLASNCSTLRFLLLWTSLELVGGLAQGRLFPYYFLPLAAPVALLFGRFARSFSPLRLFAAFAAPLAVACIGSVVFLANIGGVDDKQQLTAYLNTHHLAGGKIWADEYPRLAVETDWTPASRMPLINLLTNDDDAPVRFGNLLLSDLAQTRPELIVLRTDENKFVSYFTRRQQDVAASPIRAGRMSIAIHQLYSFVSENYVKSVDLNSLTVWRRRADARVGPLVSINGELR